MGYLSYLFWGETILVIFTLNDFQTIHNNLQNSSLSKLYYETCNFSYLRDFMTMLQQMKTTGNIQVRILNISLDMLTFFINLSKNQKVF